MKHKKIKQLLDEILTEIDVEISKIDHLDDYCIGEEDGFKGAAKIVQNIGSKYLKEDEKDYDVIKEEIIGMLTIIKGLAIESDNDTLISDVKKDSFTWVIGETISFLASLNRFKYYKEGEEHE